MEIIRYIKLPYWKIKKTRKTLVKIKSDGWKLISQSRGFFNTTYSFSKII